MAKMPDNGWVLSHRSKWINPVFRDLLEASIWAWMCETAAWQDIEIRFNGKVVKLRRGQLISSVRIIAKQFRIGERATRTFLENVKSASMIDTRTTEFGTIITICNYNRFQQRELFDNQENDTRPTHARHTPDTPYIDKQPNQPKQVKQTLTLPLEPIPPREEKSGFNKNLVLGGKKVWRIIDHISPKGAEDARAWAPGWNMLEIMDVYDAGMKVNGGHLREIPVSIDAAFVGFVKKYAKGKPPS